MYRLSRPASALDPFIEHYWHVHATPHEPFTLSVDVFVDLRADVIFNHGVAYTRAVAGAPARARTRSNLDAQRLTPIRIVQRGAVRVCGVRFRVAGLMPFCNRSVDAFTDRVVGIAEAFGEDGVRLDKALRDAAGDAPEQAALLDAFLLARMRVRPEHAPMRRLLDLIDGTHGGVRIEALGRRVGMSQRSVERLFRRCLGVGPKTYAQVVRFQRCLTRLMHEPAVTLSQVATEAGYHDQSHLVRAYKRFAGVAPVRHAGYFPPGAPRDFSPNLVEFVQA
ncbi:MAG: AraC family transcriptional regulator [Gemmatimonadaceae bacterium]|nr:AraC family transcriptional regulator [Gemmatimonadaceae bacterium]